VSQAFCTALAAIGFTSLLLQIILTRELLASFFGNELCIGLILVDWLLLVALGSGLLGAIVLRWRPSYGAFIVIQLLVAIVLPVSVFLSRRVGGAAMFPGEVIGPLLTLLLAALVLLPCCVLLGLQFAVGCRIASATAAQPAGGTGCSSTRAPSPDRDPRVASYPCHPEESRLSVPAVSRVYVLESLGAVLGGLLFHYWLADHLQPMRAVLLLGAANAACACAVALAHLEARRRRAFAGAAALVAAVLATVAVSATASRLDWASLKSRWRGLELVASENSRYGNLAVTAAAVQRSFFQDGLLMFTTEDWQPNEELAHLTLLQHPQPGRVLLVSGGLGGALAQMLQHPVEQLDYVELDPRVLSLARAHLPEELRRPLRDRRVVQHFLDGRRFIADRARSAEDAAKYDVIVVSMSDPYTGMLNRFYTEQFFGEAAAALRPGGIFCTTLSSSESFLTGPRQLLHASVYRALRGAFADVVVIPGALTYYLCATQEGVLSTDPGALSQRFAQRELQCQFMSPFWIGEKLLPFRRDQHMDALRRAPPTPVNDDFRPITYYYFLRLWVRQFSPGLADALGSAARAAAWVVGVALGAAALFAGGLWWWRGYDRVAVVGALAATGLVEMGVSLIVLFAFQVIAGYIFFQLGILITLYMGGVAVGAAAGRRWTRAGARSSALLFASCLAALAVLCLLLPHVLTFLQPRAQWANTVLGAVAFVAGALGGCAFPLAIGLTARSGADTARTGAALYAADLLGGAFGALLVTLAALPALGLAPTCRVLGLLVLAGLILVVPAVVRATRRGRESSTA